LVIFSGDPGDSNPASLTTPMIFAVILLAALCLVTSWDASENSADHR
jgi:hypothetical protein